MEVRDSLYKRATEHTSEMDGWTDVTDDDHVVTLQDGWSQQDSAVDNKVQADTKTSLRATNLPDDSHQKKIERLKEAILAMKERTKILQDTILQQDVALNVLRVVCAKSFTKLSSIEE